MTRVLMAVVAAPEVMGQQRYERAVLEAVTHLPPGDVEVRPLAVRSLRSGLPGDRRTALGQWASAPYVAGCAAAALYRGADVVHRCDLRLPAARRPEVLTIHDLAFLHFADEAVVRPGALDTARRSRVILTPSAFVAEEVRRAVSGADVRVALNGVTEDVFQAGDLTAEDRRSLGLSDRPYVLHSGGATTRKNLSQLAAAWSHVAGEVPELQLAMTGPVHPRRTELFAQLPRAHLLGLLPRTLQLRLLHSAAMVVVPSLYEGFGFPALEAMAAGVPVVAATGSSLTEVVGNAGLLVNGDAAALAAGMQRVAVEEGVADRLAAAGPPRARGFTWERSARVHLQAYADAAGG